jgi:hypothetical protein
VVVGTVKLRSYLTTGESDSDNPELVSFRERFRLDH